MDSDLLAPHDLAPIVTFRDRFIDSELRSLVFRNVYLALALASPVKV